VRKSRTLGSVRGGGGNGHPYRDQRSLRRALAEYITHFHEERDHQGLENRLIREMPAVAENDASIHRRTRLGGMLSYYHRVAA